MADTDVREASLEYHRAKPPGKISILPTKQLTNQRDLALAYTLQAQLEAEGKSSAS